MVRPTFKAPPLLAGILLFLLSGGITPPLMRLCMGDVAGGASRRILDIQSRVYKDSLFRISIRLTEIPPYVVGEVQPGRPLRIEFGQTAADPSCRSRFVPNALVRDVRAVEEKPGDTALEFSLALSQVTVDKMEMPSEGILIVDLRLRPGVTLPAVPEIAPPEATPSSAAPPPDQTGAASATAPEFPIALPEERPLERVSSAAPAGDARTTSTQPSQKAGDILTRVAMRFPGSEKMWTAYQKGDFLNAFELGLRGLRTRQPRDSMEALLYLLAECRYEIAKKKMSRLVKEEPDWPSVLNYYEQALRFSPDSKFRPLIVYRISEICGYLGKYQEQYAMLLSLWKGKETLSPLMPPDALIDTAQAALGLNAYSPASKEYLDDARMALETYLEKYPDGSQHNFAYLLLSETYYRKGEDRKAFEAVFRKNVPLKQYPDIYEHLALVTHRVGAADVVSPRNDTDKGFADVLLKSQDPAIRLEYAGMLREGGARREAMRVYNSVIQDFPQPASFDKVFPARLALTQFALEDALGKGKDSSIPYEDYVHPLRALKDLYENSFTAQRRKSVLKEVVRHLAAEGRDVEAVRLVLPHLCEGRLLEAEALELSQSIQGAMDKIPDYLRKENDWLLAFQVCDGFGKYLDSYPKKDELLLECARVLLDAGFREQVRKALARLSPWMNLAPAQQAALNLLNRELSLDPAKPEDIKRDAPPLLHPDYDPPSRAHAARLLGQAYAEEGNHVQAAQYYLQGAGIAELPWRERAAFFERAAREYAAAPNYAKVLEIAWQGLRDVELSGVPLSQSEKEAGGFLLLLGENFQRLGDLDKSALAYEQYLKLFPDAADASEIRFSLAQAYEQADQRAKALDQYDLLAGQKQADPFWADAARKTADYLRWQNEHPYLLKAKEGP